MLPLDVFKGLMIRIDNKLIGNNVMSPMFKGSDNDKELLIICRTLSP